MNSYFKFVSVVVIALTLSACGVKGPLYDPDKVDLTAVTTSLLFTNLA